MVKGNHPVFLAVLWLKRPSQKQYMGEGKAKPTRGFKMLWFAFQFWGACVCVCVCLGWRGRRREREEKGQKQIEKKTVLLL